ncbi:MAG: hypothetical protein HN403_15400 [Rhodospirillales bacterium]|jgi:hypothetical protein|nr:hypothetical protein [Rhodospirillales bacterium]
MAALTSLVALGGLFGACLGSGAAVLAVLGLWRGREEAERSALAFAVGFGVLGWVFFWFGVANAFSAPKAWLICLVLSLGLALFRLPGSEPAIKRPLGWLERILLALLAIAFFADGLEALAPPVEADTLAYHFDLPRRFAEAGKLFFVPRALDGAIPLLVQQTYTAALLLSGGEELALTLWTFLSGWGASALMFTLARRWLDLPWALAIALLFQTLPAMLYGAGSGSIEARMAMFVLIAVFGLREFRKSGSMATVIVIGLGAGLYAASKYSGLLFVAAAGLTLLMFSGRVWLRNGLLCGAVVVIIGGQWFAWNVFHTGDPVFPVLFDVLGLPDGPYWDADYAADMKAYLAVRHQQISWWERWLAYPVAATLFPAVAMEAGRVGLGPFFLMVAPFSLFGIWLFRDRVRKSLLFPAAICLGIFYVLWLKFGGIPKVRHLLPVLPILLLLLAKSTKRACEIRPKLGDPVGAAFILAIALNFVALGFFARPYVQYAFSNQTRAAFLARQINGYEAVEWLNRRSGVAKVVAMNRHYLYYIEAPAFFPFRKFQKIYETRAGHVAAEGFYRQLNENGISHVLTDRPVSSSHGEASVDSALDVLEASDCIVRIGQFDAPWHASRTVPSQKENQLSLEVWRVKGRGCSLTNSD